MKVTIERNDSVRVIAHALAALALAAAPLWTHAAVDADQARAVAPAGDGWQVLSAPAAKAAAITPVNRGAEAAAPVVAQAGQGVVPSMAVAPVVLPGTPSTTTGVLTLSVSPQDRNLRNALDRWLQTQGWQLAWKVDDDLPLEFNATFTGDFTSVLVQVMKATNHMRVPTRVCRHINNVIRVVARAANCQE
ncbi:hypothetical protein GGD68_007082 [Paraburkholderia fungorum]|jgi:hypothetical protein|uniref:toxin co-regulated pilus biosynthesis Q family protein n=1 Tax=Paraburkholderia fungorum TaxID=134537 RepID=UPI0016077B2A|nr:toxin co-regulated pilus biosynthesis Q family protein [Paraburkholderia fungorum]MBB4518276.1 hypothetical protein [Paraburkholderia fungorum]